VIIVPAYLEKSEIHGFGVFANAFIPKGGKVWEFNPIFDVIISKEDYEALPQTVKEEVEVHCYQYEENGNYLYESTIGKYMNHSAAPNLDFTQDGLGFALHDIQPGEELTCDYRHFMTDVSHIEYL
jgi:hypothetical protein